MPRPRSRCASACPRACACSPATTSTTSASSAGRTCPTPLSRPRSASARQHSDALLGAFAAITPVASAAIQALDAGDPARYLEILGPTEELSRQVFAAPTFYYKTGVAFLSWLNGHQSAFQMVGGLHSARSLPHLSRIVELANASHALEQPELAAAALARHAAPERSGRMTALMTSRPPPVDQPGDDQVRRPRDRPAGDRRGGRAGDRPVARAGAGGRPRDGRAAAHRLGPALHDALPRRLLHPARGPRAPRRDRRQPRRDRRGRDPRRRRRRRAPPRSSCSSPAACPRARAT